MAWLDDLAAAFPHPRDDEPPELRARIVKELRDHLTCAYRRELVLCGNETDAERRVLKKFGDPRQIARKLWLDAMQEKIMSQRWMFAWSSALSAACLAMVGFVWHGAQQSAEASRSMIANLQESNRQFVEQGRAFNALVLERLNQPEHNAAPAALPDATRLKFRVVQGSADGAPAPGCRVSIQSLAYKPDGSCPPAFYVDESDARGTVDCGLLAPGSYEYCVYAPNFTYSSQKFYLRFGTSEQMEMLICPPYDGPDHRVAFEVDWPNDVRTQWNGWGLLASYEMTGQIVAGKLWYPFDGDEAKVFGSYDPANRPQRFGHVLIFPDGRYRRLPYGLQFHSQGQGGCSIVTVPTERKEESETFTLRGSNHNLQILGIMRNDPLPAAGPNDAGQRFPLVRWVLNYAPGFEVTHSDNGLTRIPLAFSDEFTSRLQTTRLQDVNWK